MVIQFKKEYTSVMIVPTGVGATIGGFAGDALPVARALASVVDCLISHPNVCFLSLTLTQKGCFGHLLLISAMGRVWDGSPYPVPVLIL